MIHFHVRHISMFVLCLLFFAGRAPEDLRPFVISGTAQGTTYRVTYYATKSVVTKMQVDRLLDQVDSSLSVYKPYSLISRFNRSKKGVLMDAHLEAVVRSALAISAETGGISDITVMPLMEAWGFGVNGKGAEPDSAAIRNLLPVVGYKNLSIKGRRLIKHKKGVRIDVNGIAQGYAVDLMADLLDHHRVLNYVVELGGEIMVRGKKYPGAQPMKIGLEAPGDESSALPVILQVIQIDSGAVTTSGNYRRYVQLKNGKKIQHLISPFTGFPFANELVSVTVWAHDAITADGYDNALMGMGLHNALEFLSRHQELQAYFLYLDGDDIVRDTATAAFPARSAN
jgi:thiamine biosynthesis lipoprotein